MFISIFHLKKKFDRKNFCMQYYNLRLLESQFCYKNDEKGHIRLNEIGTMCKNVPK